MVWFAIVILALCVGGLLYLHLRVADIMRVQGLRLDDLETGRPVKIEDGPTRMSQLRQDR